MQPWAAINYSSGNETAETIANAAFAKCKGNWLVYRKEANVARLKYFASRHESPTMGPMSEDDDRRYEVEELKLLVFDTRAARNNHEKAH